MYATPNDMAERFEYEMNSFEQVSIDKALSDATNQINSYLSSRYSVPVITSDSFLQLIACNIARYRLWDKKASDEVKERYKESVDWLKDVQAGKANVAGAKLLTTQEKAQLYPLPVTPIGNTNKGLVFGDDVFAMQPQI